MTLHPDDEIVITMSEADFSRFRKLLEEIEGLAHEDGSRLAHEALKLCPAAETLTLAWLDRKLAEFP